MKNKIELLIEKIKQIKPAYGSITIEMIFHQTTLSKVKIVNRTEIIIFEKEKKNEQ